MALEVGLGFLHYLAFAAVGEFALRFFERNPLSAAHFDAHVGRDFADASGFVAQKIKADHLEDALVVCPGTNVEVFDVGEFGERDSDDSSFFLHLADGSGFGFLARIDQTFGQRENNFGGSFLRWA